MIELKYEEQYKLACRLEKGDYWNNEHPDYPFKKWVDEANANNTRLGYWDWVRNCIESDYCP